MPSNTITFYLERATCFGRLDHHRVHQHNILKYGIVQKRAYSPYGFTLWDPTSLQCLLYNMRLQNMVVQ
jgi:hypothetical protein